MEGSRGAGGAGHGGEKESARPRASRYVDQRGQSRIDGETSGRLAGEGPRAPRIVALFGDERAKPAVLTFLWDTRAGEFVSLAALGGTKRGDPAEEEEEEGPPPLRMSIFLCSSLVRPFPFPFPLPFSFHHVI